MGRHHLLSRRPRASAAGVALAIAGMLTAACGGPPAGAVARPDAEEGHRNLICVDCHDGPLADRGLAQAPGESCATAQCHTEGGPREARIGSVVFAHRDHGGDSTQVAISCTGCHTHADAQAPLVAEVDACSFCHIGEQAAGPAGECRLCHQNLEHAGVTSQQVAVPHDDLPWMDGGCVRCHYDVTEPPAEISVLRCGSCHDDIDEAVTQGLGTDLHENHTATSCISCHEEGAHRIQAMSSAVQLSCVDCHRQEHDVAVTADFPDAVTCNYCHSDAHEAQQRLLLGVVTELEAPRPSAKFMDGLTCRSCHQAAPGSDPAVAVAGNDATCVECHRREYRRVEDWWIEGSEQRLRRVEAFAATASTRLGEDPGPDAAAELAAAASMLELVRSGGAVHNLALAHRLMEEASSRIGEAYRLAGRSVPAAPDLGREPSTGLCSYCHYRVNEPWLFQEMSGAFHREVMVRAQGR
jgi:predicted CXXCH cytochrome family protein